MRQKPKITKYARQLRLNATDAENCLWHILRNRQLAGYRFRRQHPVGKYIADFVCIKYRLIVELDGGQHADNARDVVRTANLEKDGWKVVRFWNTDVLTNEEGVYLTLLDEIKTRGIPSPALGREREGPNRPCDWEGEGP
jgi:primosomal protein N' (replication factor Y)